MKSLWSETEAALCTCDLALRVYTSRCSGVSRGLSTLSSLSRDVAEMAAEMCGPLFAKTTAAQVPVDGGDELI
jgi:hypothetical protein